MQKTSNVVAYDEQYAMVIARAITDLNDKSLNDTAFIQTYGLSKGLNVFGNKGKEAALKEIAQLHNRNCFKPIDIGTLTKEQRKKVLQQLIFLVEKRDGTIKARSVADGSKQ